MRDRLLRPGMLAYISGIILNIVAIFTPYVRYSYSHELYVDAKGSYSLFGINNIKDDFLASEAPGVVLSFVPVILLLAIAAGIVCLILQLKGTNISSLIMFLAPALSVLGYIIVRLNSVAKSVISYIRDMDDEMLLAGYTGSGGYGAGAFLIIISIIIMISGAVMICMEE